jgi:hypothetical protein
MIVINYLIIVNDCFKLTFAVDDYWLIKKLI